MRAPKATDHRIGDTEVTKDNYDTMVKNLEGDKLTSIDITYQRGGEKKTVKCDARIQCEICLP